ncbi:type II toxin-antitoxin system HicA family toxin [candidate division WOR-3 bacterium]|nr:type II toxin-antitoxin system HicA family toxin [candidate division WOR-3 bacterium]
MGRSLRGIKAREAIKAFIPLEKVADFIPRSFPNKADDGLIPPSRITVRGRGSLTGFIKAGGIKRPGKGSHINIKMPNGMLITIPSKGELKIGLLKSAIYKAGLTEEQFTDLL